MFAFVFALFSFASAFVLDSGSCLTAVLFRLRDPPRAAFALCTVQRRLGPGHLWLYAQDQIFWEEGKAYRENRLPSTSACISLRSE